MRVVQWEMPGEGRRVGVVDGDALLDVTAGDASLDRVSAVFDSACRDGVSFEERLSRVVANEDLPRVNYSELLAASPGGESPFLHPPLDHPDPHYLLVSGTGLTHTGGMESRDKMHSGDSGGPGRTDDRFRADVRDGVGRRKTWTGGAWRHARVVLQREWIHVARAGRTPRPPRLWFGWWRGNPGKLVGCYIVDSAGVPRRLGFRWGLNGLITRQRRSTTCPLAPSKLRTCPGGTGKLVTDWEFPDIDLQCTVRREGEMIYESGPLKSGEKFMCHSLANCEDHHF
ncbi:MAG: hypothetical protein CM1200mP2_11110 [Planctomycetaceae bacterium]|nr:MAG: hypothetical protein CM1200mP2_11110 [Planctomycetaceae bacterium]